MSKLDIFNIELKVKLFDSAPGKSIIYIPGTLVRTHTIYNECRVINPSPMPPSLMLFARFASNTTVYKIDSRLDVCYCFFFFCIPDVAIRPIPMIPNTVR